MIQERRSVGNPVTITPMPNDLDRLSHPKAAMRPRTILSCMLLLVPVLAAAVRAEEQPLKEGWDYAPAMKKIAAGFKGKPGVVIHVGDSITYANPYSSWARAGEGQTES